MMTWGRGAQWSTRFAWMVLAVCLTVYAEASETVSSETLTERIKTILTTLRYDLAAQNKFCRAFFQDFQAQKAIVHIQPIVQTDDYQAPELQQYLKRCPKLNLNRRVTVEPRYSEWIKSLPEEEQDRYSDVYRGTRNFRLYLVEINNNQADGEEFIFYQEKFLHVSHLGEQALAGAGEEYDDRGSYTVVQPHTCEILGGTGVDMWRELATVPNYHGIVKHQKLFYIFDVYPSRGADTYSVNIDSYDTRRGRVIPLCTIHPVLPEQERAK